MNEDLSKLTPEKETRWNRFYRTRPDTLSVQSKFYTGEEQISLEELSRVWPSWNTAEREDFIRAFSSNDEAHSGTIFRYMVEHAGPDDRSHFWWKLVCHKDHDEAFRIASEWLIDPATYNKPMLISSVGTFGEHKLVETEKPVRVLQQVLEQGLADGKFWDFATWRAPEIEMRAREVIACCGELYKLTKRPEYVLMLERLDCCPDLNIAELARWHLRGLGFRGTRFHLFLKRMWTRLRSTMGLRDDA